MKVIVILTTCLHVSLHVSTDYLCLTDILTVVISVISSLMRVKSSRCAVKQRSCSGLLLCFWKQVSAAASSPPLRACGLFLSGRRNPLLWLQQQQLSAALQPCSPSPEHWPAGDNISKGVVIATHYIIIISDLSPFTPTAE